MQHSCKQRSLSLFNAIIRGMASAFTSMPNFNYKGVSYITATTSWNMNNSDSALFTGFEFTEVKFQFFAFQNVSITSTRLTRAGWDRGYWAQEVSTKFNQLKKNIVDIPYRRPVANWSSKWGSTLALGFLASSFLWTWLERCLLAKSSTASAAAAPFFLRPRGTP